MKNRLMIICSIIICLSCICISRPVPAADTSPALFSTNPQPLKKTPIEMHESSIDIGWYEEWVEIEGSYCLVNPTENKVALTLQLQLNSPDLAPNITVVRKPATASALLDSATPEPTAPKQTKAKSTTPENEKQTVESRYDNSRKSYLWEITFAPEEELDLLVEYPLLASVAEDGLNKIAFSRLPNVFWASDKESSAVYINFIEVHPGQLTSIEPGSYNFHADSLVFTLPPPADAPINVSLAADVYKEKSAWETLLTEEERKQLALYQESGDFFSAAELFARLSESALDLEKESLLVGQAYYLEKDGRTREAESIWKDLYENDSKFPRVYWSLGRINAKQIAKIKTYHNSVRDREVHPLIQEWLMAQIPDYVHVPSSPEITNTVAIITESKKGITLKSTLIDKDGDIKSAKLLFYWENEEAQDYSFSLLPYRYKYELDYFIAGAQPLRKLFYELIVTDRENNVVSTGQREAFYIKEDLPSETISLPGAVLVMADYTPGEQDKVHKWFKSYIKMAKEAGFVPLEMQSPYLIFLGRQHQFVEEIAATKVFVQYTPRPFTPSSVENKVHRFFLSNLYGQGWNTMPAKQFNSLGEGLMLGKGPAVLTLRYLQDKDEHQYGALLFAMGDGRDWFEAIEDIYGISPARLRVNVFRHAFGKYILAVLIILLLAWLGKTGYLLNLIERLRSLRTP